MLIECLRFYLRVACARPKIVFPAELYIAVCRLLLGMHMKLFLIAFASLLVSFSIGHATTGGFSHASSSLIPSPGSHRDNVPKMARLSPDVQFAQLEAPDHASIFSTLVLTLVVVSVITFRLVGLNRARAMADHERDTYRGKAQMFRSLHEERTDRE